MQRCRRCSWQGALRGGVWCFTADLEPGGYGPERADGLAEIEAEHFWFPPRRRLLASLLGRVAPGEAAIELGCGGGTFLPSLVRRFGTTVGIDAYEHALRRAHGRVPSAVLATADATQVPLGAGQFDLVVALDVLEHVDSRSLLAESRRLCRPGGWLMLSVPAFPCLWSAFDVKAGHRCRYRRRRLEAELAVAGWSLEHWTHYQAALFPLIFVSRRLMGRALQRAERRPPRLAGRLLGAVNDLEVRFFARRRLRFGSSLCALARNLE